MLCFEQLNINSELKSILNKYKVDFVFQPIFSKDESLMGYEALMRPEGKNILDFIEEMRAEDKLHEMELLTFFGATLAYLQREYDKMLSINSFPAECFSKEEVLEFSKCFEQVVGKLIVEILEYTEGSHHIWEEKQAFISTQHCAEIALDDFGTGHNNINAVEYYKPQMIKLDRTLISDIDKYEDKQHKVKEIVWEMHSRKVAVLAEGVETKEEYEFLKSIDVDYFQGYYLGRPM